MTISSWNKLEWLEKKLLDDFEIKDLGALKYWLGMEIFRFKVCLSLNINIYLIYETMFLGYKATETPIETNLEL